MRQLDEIEDGYLALERLDRGGTRVSLEALEREFMAPAADAPTTD